MNISLKNISMIAAAALAVSVAATSCVRDLDVTPIDPNLALLDDPDYLFNKCYATLAMAGNSDVDGDCDVDGIDGGTSGFIRQMWNANELTTDEAYCVWGDPGIDGFDFNTYDAAHPMLRGYYYRLYTAITFCNHYLEVASEADPVKTAEIRFLRAFEYFLALSGYGPNIPFVTAVSSDKPVPGKDHEIYDFIESELLDIESKLSAPKVVKEGEAGYGRVSQAAAWLLLARLYLNAEVFTGTPQWVKAAEYAQKVIASPFKLNTTGTPNATAYEMLFMGDNGSSSAAQEAVFAIMGNSLKTASWGMTLFLIASTYNGDMLAQYPIGTSEAWGGNVARPDLVQKFFPNLSSVPAEAMKDEFVSAAGDDRALFWSVGHSLNTGVITDFTEQIAVVKYNNLYSDGGTSPTEGQYVDTDFFLLRAAEAYLTYAEATARQNGGKATSDGLARLNDLRNRAHASKLASANLDQILDEWSREFYFEGRRRLDLIRYGYYGGENSYNWWNKGGVPAGASFPAYRNIFAIPTTDLTANSNLSQNPGYNVTAE
ncbi:MAG: RagB/SusD family nutrient uptake outer membrane protein [Bacteroidales bacterium]|nr:RagB/SusD family nutrient uptake outer membrane protein [Bacteroidales bacterium]